jgi:hypothetical protein
LGDEDPSLRSGWIGSFYLAKIIKDLLRQENNKTLLMRYAMLETSEGILKSRWSDSYEALSTLWNALTRECAFLWHMRANPISRVACAGCRTSCRSGYDTTATSGSSIAKPASS